MIITPAIIAEAIASTPIWAEIAPRVPRESICNDACRQGAPHVNNALCGPSAAEVTAELALPL
jgi:hypothetical protein